MSNKSLKRAKVNKEDEFYTKYKTVEATLVRYKSQFRGKIVYCNCDDYRVSNFYKYLYNNFKEFGLKRLVATCYGQPDLFGEGRSALYAEYDGDIETSRNLDGDGDFRSAECINILKKADLVVTNPPFSIFGDYFALLDRYKKSFLIITSLMAYQNKYVVPYIKKGSITVDTTHGSGMTFETPTGDKKVLCCWLTNLESNFVGKPIELTKKYSDDNYLRYANYDGIDVPNLFDIPIDYNEVMGVPITIILYDVWDQFEFLGCCHSFTNTWGDLIAPIKKENPRTKLNRKLLIEYDPRYHDKPKYKSLDTGKLYVMPFRRVFIKRR